MNIYVANWKMNMNTQNVFDWISKWKGDSENITGEVIIAPTYIHMPLLANFKTVDLAAQDISKHPKGSHTGDVGAFQVAEYCKYAIIGHSERNEDRKTVLSKIKEALSMELLPIVCFVDQTKIADYYQEGVLLAWEDPDNISKEGNYNAKNPEEIKTNIEKMKKSLPKEAKILYGGSVNRENIVELKQMEKLDGVLVGHASIDAEHFFEICTK